MPPVPKKSFFSDGFFDDVIDDHLWDNTHVVSSPLRRSEPTFQRNGNEMVFNNLRRPHCARCDAPVEDVSVDRDILYDKFILTMRCHGNQEVMEIFADDLMQNPQAVADRLDGHTAFESDRENPFGFGRGMQEFVEGQRRQDRRRERDFRSQYLGTFLPSDDEMLQTIPPRHSNCDTDERSSSDIIDTMGYALARSGVGADANINERSSRNAAGMVDANSRLGRVFRTNDPNIQFYPLGDLSMNALGAMGITGRMETSSNSDDEIEEKPQETVLEVETRLTTIGRRKIKL